MKYLVLDTNVYLHFKHFEQINWKSILHNDVTICVPQKVLAEIDKYKDQSHGKIQKRAKVLSARFYEIFLEGVTPQVPVINMSNPPANAFDDPQYHQEISDDWIILSALHSSISNADIVIVSYDNGILLKAKQHGLGFYKVPDCLLLAEEPSEEEKEIKRLSQQLAKYENRLPKPVVEFENETSLLTINKPHFIEIKKEIESYETDLKATHRYESLNDQQVDDFTLAIQPLLSLTHSTLYQKQEYNKALDDYFEKKLKLKKFQLVSQLMDQRFVKLNFWLSNGGTSALGNTIVFLYFPSDVAVYNQHSRVVVRSEDPKEPILKNNMTIYNNSLMDLINSDHKIIEDIEIWDARKKLDQSEFKYQSSHLLHTMRHPLEGKNDLYIDIATCGNFTIEWSVIDSELIEPVKGQLHVVVKDSPTTSHPIII